MNSSERIRSDRFLFDEFKRLYEETYKRKLNCASCQLNEEIEKWKRLHIVTSSKSESEMENTFVLAKNKKFIRVPFTPHVITKTSPDEHVHTYLNQVPGEQRLLREANFEKLPSQVKISEEKNVVEDSGDKPTRKYVKKNGKGKAH